MNELLNEVDRVIRSHGLLRRGQSVLVAVSGGLDSMVLLHLLGCLAEENRWRLTVAHLNHGLRGRSSDADERLVIRTAREMNLPVVTGRVDVEQEARNGRISIEMAAREVRHRFFARAAMERRIRTVALAHHQDDQVELFFLRLLRGSTTEGVGGMKWRSPSPASGRVQLVRPLLGCSRSDLMSYARAHRIRHREDASNATIDFQRNRIRHELLPLLQRFQPALNRVITRFMEVCASDADYVGTAAEQWLAASAGEFDRLHAAVQR
ncbi:MAG TPA: tRNA lysidine(34) synthetase TilS, partial [Verrucomicrobiota bacterium]|nr:tRNA lysidine(34) synthetase TilS [Verrucomicrobiota bacterium]